MSEDKPNANPPLPRRDFLGGVLGFTALSGAATPLLWSLFNRPPESLASREKKVGDGEFVLLFTNEEIEKRKKQKPKKLESFDIKVRKLDGWRVKEESNRVYSSLDGEGIPRYFTAICPHAGCVVELRRPKEGQPSFYCPCHKGVFNADGSVKEGPAKRSLDELETRRSDKGLEIRIQQFQMNRAEKEAL